MFIIVEKFFGQLLIIIFFLFQPLGKFLRKLADNLPEYQQSQKFHQLQTDLRVAYQNNEPSKAEMLADELIDMARHYKDNWDYANAIHWAYITKGKIALDKKDIKAVKNYLIKSMIINNSPQIFAYGPDLDLIKRLKSYDCNDAINEYIAWSKRKWRYGKKTLEEIQSGPNT